MGTRGTTKRLIVDNYYGYDFVNGAFVTVDKGSIEQVPVAKLVGLPYDTYDVTVTVVYHQKLDHTGDSSYSFWLDGIRVYDSHGQQLLRLCFGQRGGASVCGAAEGAC